MPNNTGFLTLSDVVDPYAAVKGQQQTMQLGASLANVEQDRRALDIREQHNRATETKAVYDIGQNEAYKKEIGEAMAGPPEKRASAVLTTEMKYHPDKAIKMWMDDQLVQGVAQESGLTPAFVELAMKDDRGREILYDNVGARYEKRAESFKKLSEQFAPVAGIASEYQAGKKRIQTMIDESGLAALDQVIEATKPEEKLGLVDMEKEKAHADAVRRRDTIRTQINQQAQKMIGAFTTKLSKATSQARTALSVTEEAALQGVPVDPEILKAQTDAVHNLEQFAASAMDHIRTGSPAKHEEAMSYATAAENVFARVNTTATELFAQRREQRLAQVQQKADEAKYKGLSTDETSYAKAHNLNPLVPDQMTKIREGAAAETANRKASPMELQTAEVQNEAARLGITDDKGLQKLNRDLAAKTGRPLAKLDDIKAAQKDPNRPIVEVNLEKLTPEQAGRVSSLITAHRDIRHVTDRLINSETGAVDRKLLFSTNIFPGGFPFSEGKDINGMIYNAIEAKLRLDTGAAANKDEVKRIAKNFIPSLTDDDATIKSKLNRFERYTGDTLDLVDPKQTLRGRIGKTAPAAGEWKIEKVP